MISLRATLQKEDYNKKVCLQQMQLKWFLLQKEANANRMCWESANDRCNIL